VLDLLKDWNAEGGRAGIVSISESSAIEAINFHRGAGHRQDAGFCNPAREVISRSERGGSFRLDRELMETDRKAAVELATSQGPPRAPSDLRKPTT
jgi:hypothetical protein